LKKKRILFWVGVVISLVGLWLAFRGIEFHELGVALAQANYWWLIPALVLHLISVVARSERWRLLLGADRVDSVTAFLVLHLGYLIMNVLPWRLGDPARAVIIDQRNHVGLPRALSTVVVERVFDGLTVVLFLVLLVPFMQLPPDIMRWMRVFGGLGLLAILGIVLLLTQRVLAERILMAMLMRVPRVSPDKWLARWRSLVSGFETLGSARGALAVIGLTLLTWLTAIGVFWAILQAFFPGESLAPATFLLCVESFFMAVPATPGNWGVFEGVANVGLTVPFGFPLARAVAYAGVLHSFEYLAVNVVGVFALMRYSLSLGEISARAEKVSASIEEL